MPEVSTELLDVAIVGAGWFGLKAARTYLDLEPNTNLAVFDGDNCVGGVWSKERIYPTLVGQIGFGYFNYPGTPMSSDGMPNSHLVTGEMVQQYLEHFAIGNDLMPLIRLNSWVKKIERCPRGWRLTANGHHIESTKLILACGITSVPTEVPFKVEPGASVGHSRDIAKRLHTLEACNDVVVLGAGKSAYDAVHLLYSMGKRVTWIIRPDGSGPMPIMPHKIAGLNTITVVSTRLMSYLSPSMFNTHTLLGSFFHRTSLGRWLTRFKWGFITSTCDKVAGFGQAEGIDALKPALVEQSCFWCGSSLGLITIPEFWSTLQNGNLTVIRDSIETAKTGSVILRSGRMIDCDYVLHATGWGDHFAFLSPELKQELGIPAYTTRVDEDENDDFWAAHDLAAEEAVTKSIPILATGPVRDKWHPDRVTPKRRWRLYNRCISLSCARSGDRSIAILGQIYTVQTPVIAEIQSLWAISYMLGELALPDERDFVQEICEFQAWTRMRYTSAGERYPYALFDWIGYLDRLLKDMGLQSHRKGNFIAEYLSPYGPEDYAGCLKEYIAKRSGKQT
ncbi:putative dimethylaniline monooxygenase [Aspergillus minisclerotigenes]|uniref:Putative dimethylaniline monooxygenase n=1 Tax=Aspergillus minisclerotigenes TaxID=656917 RepID=A0A5N6J0W6_9EURO|nr:putative dimethylaniline monooxygenase [Aspergillus minisclerotigenes]